MDILKEIVQNVLIIVLLNVLLEMVIPNSSLGRYIKLVMGLFIIVAVLNPILGFLNRDFSILTVSPAEYRGEDLNSLVRKGKSLDSEMKRAALKDYAQKISQQVSALARLDGSAAVQKVVVDLEDNPEAANFGQLKEIVVYLGKNPQAGGNSSGSAGVKPVEINVSGAQEESKTGETQNKDVIKLQGVLADFYGINPDNIKIVFSGK
ncbi:stage III sporulation protein AF [Thermincola potens]|uniref:Stage III sporulation protein AF n=1 Tax=Thermincola potens (strain JR) TaxID=635013 RepID=D5X7K2_THEPJ|nr:stage III sporulation protein AF [Thermincola potens]ADG82572.1 stage III sporulation protein AF [Thermincola potens JR]